MSKQTMNERSFENHDKNAYALMGTIFVMLLTWGILLGTWGIWLLIKELFRLL